MAIATESLFSAEDAALRELQISAKEFEFPPYFGPKFPDERLNNALALVQNGAVSFIEERGYVVKGRTRSYEVGESCSCEDFTKRKNVWCYHRIAMKLFQHWRMRLGDKPMPTTASAELPLGPSTVEERLAQEGTKEPQDATGNAQGSADVPTSQNGATSQPEARNEPIRLPLPLGRMLRPLHAILADLRRPLPENCIPSFQRKGTTIKFVHWYQVTRLLDMYAPGWEVEVVGYDEMKGATIRLRLTIHCAEGHVSRDGVGREDEDEVDYGNRATNSYAQAFKRAASLFGVDWLYDNHGYAERTDEYLFAEQAKYVGFLGKACEDAGLDKQAYVLALRAQAGVRRWEHIPLAMCQEAIACVEEFAAQRKA